MWVLNVKRPLYETMNATSSMFLPPGFEAPAISTVFCAMMPAVCLKYWNILAIMWLCTTILRTTVGYQVDYSSVPDNQPVPNCVFEPGHLVCDGTHTLLKGLIAVTSTYLYFRLERYIWGDIHWD